MDAKNDTILEPVKNNPNQAFTPEYKALYVRPWSRLFAKYIDLYVFGFLLGVIIAIIAILFYPSLALNNHFFNGFIVLFLWFLVEPLILYSLGTTLGRFLFNIKLTDMNGAKLTLSAAYKRSFSVWVFGFGLGVPFITPLTLICGYIKLTKTGSTYWDENQFIVTHQPVGYVKGSIIVLILLSFIGATIYDYKQQAYSKSPEYYAEEIEKANKTLPVMADDETELYGMHLIDDTVTYQYRLIHIDAKHFNADKFYDFQRKEILNAACGKDSTNVAFGFGYHFSFNYYDKNNKPIINIVVTSADCDAQ